MPLKEPSWWYDNPSSRMPGILRPLARIYAERAVARHARSRPYRSRLPVICVGNFTAGGTGKTPLSMHIAARLTAMGERPAILTRGYGGKLRGPHWVDPDRDVAMDTGDEPLLLARTAPTLIASDRRAGAICIEIEAASAPERSPTAIIMDDGLQNPALIKDFTIAVVDGRRGLGNGKVIPAGPLRMELVDQLPLADAVVVNSRSYNGDDPDQTETGIFQAMRREFPGPVLAAETQPYGDLDWLPQEPIVAFAGIANPDRFFSLLERHGANLVQRVVFKDHQAFQERDAARLLKSAHFLQARLVTTEKDYVRLKGGGTSLNQLRAATRTLRIGLKFNGADAQRLDALLASALSSGGYRNGLQGHGARITDPK